MYITDVKYISWGVILSQISTINVHHIESTNDEVSHIADASTPSFVEVTESMYQYKVTSMRLNDDIPPENTTYNRGNDSLAEPKQCVVMPSHFDMTSVILFHLIFGVISCIVNSLSITVHRRKRMHMAIILIALCIADICQGSSNLVIATWDVLHPHFNIVKTLFDVGTFSSFWMGLMIVLYLERVSQALNALMCLDRFLVLTGSLGYVSIIQKQSKRFAMGVWLIILVMTTIDAYSYAITDIKFPVNSCDDNLAADNGSGWNKTTTTLAPLEEVLTTNSNINATTTLSTLLLVAKYVPIVNNFIMYLLLLIVIVLNISTHILLQVRAKQRRWLTEGNVEKQQSNILLVITSIYTLLALPSTSFKLVAELNNLHIITLSMYKYKLFLDLMRVGAIFDQIKNTSDFFVFMIMSRMFRQSLQKSFCSQKQKKMETTTTSTVTGSFKKY